jgi:hypothetical protein
LGVFLFFLWFELHRSFSQATFNIKSSSAFQSEGPELKLGSKLDSSLSLGSLFYFILWLFELHGSLYRAILGTNSSSAFESVRFELKLRSKSD